MKTIKRILSVILVLTMLTGMLPLNIIAAETEDNSGYMELSDGYLSVKVSKKNGGFLIDTLEGNKLKKSDDNKFLLYPDEDYDTSYTSFRVTRNGKTNDYIFGRDYGFLGLSSSDVVLSQVKDGIKAVWSVDDITFTQTLTLLDTTANQHGMVYITYEAENKGDDAQIEARIMLDTALGYQDYAIYELTQPSGEYLTVESEKVLDGKSYSSSFFAYDDEFAPSVTAYNVNATVNNVLVQPETVAFGHWNNLAATVFDFVPDEELYFTNPINSYLTADSAYAMYYDMGSVSKNAAAQAIGTYYGVYSNAGIDVSEKIAINFEMPQGLTLNDDLSGYVSSQGDGAPGTFAMNVKITNISEENIESMAVAIYPESGLTPYDTNGDLYTAGTYDNPYYIRIVDMLPGEERQAVVNFAAVPANNTQYRKIGVTVFDYKDTTHLLEERIIGERDAYILCPAGSGDALGFTGITPETIYTEGSRSLYLTGSNFAFIRDKESYDVVLRPADGRLDIIVPTDRVFVDPEESTAELVLDMSLTEGTWQVIFDWKDPTKLDATSDALRFNVSNSASYKNMTYGVLVIDENPDYDESADNTNKYRITVYDTEAMYEAEKDWRADDFMDTTLMEFRGSFSVTYADDGKTIVGAKATAVEGGDSINISKSLDVDNGTLEITVENAGTPEQGILVDIDGEVYTSVARTKVWDGVCALTTIGNNTILSKYNQIGKHLDDKVETSEANKDTIMLCWPGAASGAQTLAGMVMEFRYAEFGRMFTESDKNEGSSKFVVSFGAEVSPDFLVPSTYVYDKTEQAKFDYHQDQLRLAGKPYVAKEIRDQSTRRREEIQAITDSKSGSFAIALHDILFGEGFIGFNTTVDVGIPAYTQGMPALEGTLNLKVMGAEWAMNIKGSADFIIFEMEAELGLRSHNSIPVPDKLYFFMGGVTPGINVDGFGVFWIRGLGGGVDKIYDTIFTASQLPPLTILVKAQVALFATLTATGELGISARGFSAAITNLGVAGIPILNELSGDVYWYPNIRFGAQISADILDIIYGGGSFILQEMEDESFFWEGFVTAGIKVPDWVPFIANEEIGSADLGFNAERIWGAIHVLKVDAGITYYWGGDVEFGFGKYDAPEPTVQLFSVPVYEDEKTGKVLYMSMLASESGLSESVVEKHNDIGRHDVIFPEGYSGNEDALISTTFRAESLEEAKSNVNVMYYKHISYEEGSINENYPLVFADSSKALDDPANANANAVLSFNEEQKKATLTFTVTDPMYFDYTIEVYGTNLEETNVYGMPRYADIESISLDADGTTLTVNGDISMLDNLTVYANDGSSTYYVLYEGLPSDNVTLTYPEAMPSGTYTITAVGTTEDKSANPIAEIENIEYTNPDSPDSPLVQGASLGGDYSIDVDVSAPSGEFDGYLVTVYEEDEDGNIVPTIFKDIPVDKSEVITVGGRYSTTVEAYDEGVEDGVVLEAGEIVYGLEAGKQYKIGVRSYKALDDGSYLPSSMTFSESITMIEAVKPVISMELSKKVTVDETDYTANKDVTVIISSDESLKNAKYTLDGTEDREWTDFSGNSISLTGLTDGGHKLTIRGEDAQGDGFEESYLFTVNSTSPVLMLSSPVAGSFYGDTVKVTGLTDAEATVTVTLDGTPETVTSDDKGNFSLELTMNKNVAYQDVVVKAENFLGTQSREISMTLANELLGSKNIRPVILCDGNEVEQLDENFNGKKLSVALKYGAYGDIIEINADSMMANRVFFEIVNIEGNAAITDDGILSGLDENSNGFVRASIDNIDTGVFFGTLTEDNFQNLTFEVAEVSKTADDEDFTIAATGAADGAIVTYSSSDKSVATVDNNGKVTVLKSGTVTITATASATGEYVQTRAGYTLNIAKKAVPAPTIASKIYTGSKLTADVTDTTYYTVTKNDGGVQTGRYDVVLTLTDTDKYEWTDSSDAEKTLTFIISTASAPEIIFPTASKITYGQRLSDSLLSGGSGDGIFKWSNADIIPTVSNNGFEVTFIPNNTTDYDYTGVALTKVIEVVVEPKKITRPDEAEAVYYNGTEQTYAVAATDDYTVSGNLQTNANEEGHIVTLTLTDKENTVWDNGSAEDITHRFVIRKAEPSVMSLPTVSKVTKGKTLSTATFKNGKMLGVDGTAITGTYEWVQPDKVMDTKGVYSESARFVPADSANYSDVEILVEVEVRTSGGTSVIYTITYYDVVFETNGANQIEKQSVRKYEKAKEPAKPIKDGYTFVGWFTDEELTEAYDFDTEVVKHITLYAKWTEDNTPAVSDPCDGTAADNCPSLAFTDIDTAGWYHHNVDYVLEKGMMNGMGNGVFAPNGNLSRAMLVTILWRLEGEPQVTDGVDFTDVSEDSWYTDAVAWASANGIVNGMGDGTFAPDTDITREQLAAIIYRYEQHKGGGFTGTWMFRMDYTDITEVSEWSYEAMCWCTMKGIINGKPGKLLDPKGNATRAEAAAMLNRYCELDSEN